MRSIVLILGIFLLASCQAHSQDISINIPHDPLLKSPTINVYIKDEGPFNFLVDTGATDSFISTKLAQKLGIKADESVAPSSTLEIHQINTYYYTEMMNIIIGPQRISKTTRLHIKPKHKNSDWDGTIGLSTLFNATIKNDPAQKVLSINLKDNHIICDPVKDNSICNFSVDSNPKVSASIGGEEFKLLIDTGYEGESSFILFKSDYTNKIWNHYGSAIETERNDVISNLPYGRVFTRDFIFNNSEECFADFYIKNPSDSSPRLIENVGTLGWWVIKDVPFEFDVQNGVLVYPKNVCPYQKIKTIGIGAKANIGDADTAYIYNILPGSPAQQAGLVDYDILDRIYLADGTVIDFFNDDFMNRVDDIIYPENGTIVKFEIIRDEQRETFSVQAKSPNFLNLNELN